MGRGVVGSCEFSNKTKSLTFLFVHVYTCTIGSTRKRTNIEDILYFPTGFKWPNTDWDHVG